MVVKYGGKTLAEYEEQMKALDLFSCGGKGVCKKCGIRFTKGAPLPTAEDRSAFRPKELREGYRLACKAKPKGEYVFLINKRDKNEMQVVLSSKDSAEKSNDFDNYTIVVDIGTTTIGMEARVAETGAVIASYTTINPQRSFGFDVVSRIVAATEGKALELQQVVYRAVEEGILAIKEKISDKNLLEVRIAGNTVMQHLFLGLEVEGLGQSPFSPITLKEVRGEIGGVPFKVLPGVSAFFGGDALAGLLTIDWEEEPNLFIDLGTNGEMALGNKEKIIVTSVAAGPAFDGGTVEDLWGSELIACVVEGLKSGVISEDGSIDGDSVLVKHQEEEVKISLADIRSLQLAKAAIATGVGMLCKKYGVRELTEIKKVYIAGGMGMHISLEDCIGIGMLPRELEGKMEQVGNSALEGAFQYDDKEAERIIKLCKPIYLANEPEFQEMYVGNMNLSCGKRKRV